MKKRWRIVFSIGTLTLLMLLFAQPVLAEDTYEYVYTVSYNQLPYGNGQDDDGDGVIDNIEEADVVFGDFDLNDTRPLIYQWNDTFVTEWDLNDKLTGNGIAISPYYDQLWDIESSDNASVSPTANACYIYDASLKYSNAIDAPILVADKYLPAVRFYMNLSAEDIMNGAQQVWYRSPLAYDATEMNGHILNIYRVSDGELIWCNLNKSSGLDEFDNDNPYIRKDNSTVGNASSYYRIYYRLNLNLRTGEKYRFEEYVSIIGDNPTNSIKVYIASFQDVADDGLQNTYIFHGTSNARKIPQEPSWSLLCKFGIGPVGTEVPIKASEGASWPYVNSQPLKGSVNHVKSVEILVPLRCTTNMGNIDVKLAVLSGGVEQTTHPDDLVNVGGSILYSFNITDPDAGEINYYELTLLFEDWNTDNGKDENDLITLVMYPSDGDCIIINENGNATDAQPYFFAMHWEISESEDDVPVPYIAETEDAINWLGMALLVLGIGLIILCPAIGLYVMHAGIVTSMSVGIAASVLTGVTGAVIASKGFEFMTGENLINNFLSWAGQGVARVFSGIIEGINVVVGGIVKAIIQVVQAIVSFGELLFKWGASLLSAIVDIIYLISFFVVIWITQRFLAILTAIAENDPDSAFRQMVKIEGAAKATYGRAQKYAVRPIRKGLKGGSRVVKYVKERRQDRGET